MPWPHTSDSTAKSIRSLCSQEPKLRAVSDSKIGWKAPAQRATSFRFSQVAGSSSAMRGKQSAFV
jgi:hypothetical protein